MRATQADTVVKLLLHLTNRRMPRHRLIVLHLINKALPHITPPLANMGHRNTHPRPVSIVQLRILRPLARQELIRTLLTPVRPLVSNTTTLPTVVVYRQASIPTTVIVRLLKHTLIVSFYRQDRNFWFLKFG